MEISELTLKLIIILIPGAIATRIYQKITIHDKWTSFQFIANSILFGSFSYLATEIFIDQVYNDTRLVAFWSDLQGSDVPYDIVLKACLFGVGISLLVSAIDHFKLLNWFAKKIRISNKYGDENLYSYFLNAKNVNEVYIRDLDNNTTYHGMIDSFSETDETCEIVLWDVVVYSNDPFKEVSKLDKVYLSRLKTSITIELPNKTENNVKKTDTTAIKATTPKRRFLKRKHKAS
jgi:hypothetical protein